MAETATTERVNMKVMDEFDLVRHHYNRRSLWGTDTVLYHTRHPMEWRSVEGNYQNWEVDTTQIIPSDAEDPAGEPTWPGPCTRPEAAGGRRCTAAGPKMGAIQFTPQGVDHGAGRGYTRAERNRPTDANLMGDILSAYTFKPVRGTAETFRMAKPCMC